MKILKIVVPKGEKPKSCTSECNQWNNCPHKFSSISRQDSLPKNCPVVEEEEDIVNLCAKIDESLNSATLINWKDLENNSLRLLDYLSSRSTVKSGQEEIENLVEQIYFDLTKKEDTK